MNTTKVNFTVRFLKEAQDFIQKQSVKVQIKIQATIEKSQHIIDPKFFKKLKGSEIWEFRIQHNGLQYRIFAFWDEQNCALVVATHGMIKKQWDVPKSEIEHAIALKRKYLNDK